MRLSHVEIRDFRSVFVDDSSQPMRLELGRGANTLVGPNNCGKSNVLRAISLAMDPRAEYVPEADRPGPLPYANPIVTLTFEPDDSRPDDSTVMTAVAKYRDRLGAGVGGTGGRSSVKLEVSFLPDEAGSRRTERLVVGAGKAPPDSDAEKVQAAAIAALRHAVRFVLISTGESIESVLEGNFREILHSVVREKLGEEFAAAERSRTEYVDGLRNSLLAPLRSQLSVDVQGLFPEIEALALSPSVSSIEQTLSQVGVSLEDLVSTPLSRKGTGVRGGLLVAMLGYLALNAAKSMVFALEEPEAFLHPGAQEGLRDQLELVSDVDGVTLLVSTHSPFIMSRTSQGRVLSLAKDGDGRTRVAETAPGNSDHAPLMGDLVRQESFEALLAATAAVPAGTEAVVLVEGDGDVFCLRKTAEVLGRPDLLDGLHLVAAGGTKRLVVQAVILRAALDVPLVVLLDNDDDGKRAKESLTSSHLKFQGNTVLTYANAFPKSWRSEAVEAEDVFAPELVDGFVDHHGRSVYVGSFQRPDGEWHYDFDPAAKERLNEWLTVETQPQHVERWVTVIDLVRQAAGLDALEEAPESLIAAAPRVPAQPASSGTTKPGQVLILTHKQEAARYQTYTAVILPEDLDLPDDVTHIGFYDSGIRPHVPSIRANHPNLLISPATADELRTTGREVDSEAAAFVEALVSNEPNRQGTAAHILVLSSSPGYTTVSEADAQEARTTDDGTLVLPQPVKNTKELRGRRVAWTVVPRTVPYAALAEAPTTTDELDKMTSDIEDTP